MQVNEGVGSSKKKKSKIPSDYVLAGAKVGKSLKPYKPKLKSQHKLKPHNEPKTDNTHTGHMGGTTNKKTHASKPVSRQQAFHNATKHNSTNHTPSIHHNTKSTSTHHSSTKPKVKTVAAPTVKKVKKPHITAAEQAFYNNYTKAIGSGTNNIHQLKQYQDIVSKYGLHSGSLSNDTLHSLSLKALSGDTTAQAYLKAMNFQAQDSKHGLWKGFDTTKIGDNAALRSAYMKDNPYTAYTKDYDNKQYTYYNGLISGNKQMSNQQMSDYKNITTKWNLADQTDPYVKQQQQMEKDKQAALKAQDVGLNTQMGQLDANAFNQYNQLQQDMTNRGMGDSGIAADTYMRATMGNNQNYQQAYTDAIQNKSDINTQFDQSISQSKIDQQDNINAQKAADQKAQADLQSAQTNQDKYLTQQTGYVYLNGKPLKGADGKPVRTMDYLKLNETQRHNMATENNTATKNNNDYSIANTKITADLQKSIAKNKLDYAKLDFNYKKLAAQNDFNQEKIKALVDSASDRKTKMQLTALGKQSDTVSKQIQSLQKKKTLSKSEKATLKKLVKKYNNVNNSISKLIGGENFNNDTKGADVKYKSYTGYKTFKKNFASSGVDKKWFSVMAEIVKRESGFNPNAQNPTSTAHGYGQFLTATRRNYEKKLGLDYDNPVDQITMMAEYIKDRYGTPKEALAFWNKHHWY